jgi:hypothetical protein
MIAQHPYLVVSLIFRVPEVGTHAAMSEWSILEETLEGTRCGTPQAQ